MKQTKSDPALAEIREIRHRISERFGHDPERLVAYYMELQEQYRDRFVGAPRKEPDDRSATWPYASRRPEDLEPRVPQPRRVRARLPLSR